MTEANAERSRIFPSWIARSKALTGGVPLERKFEAQLQENCVQSQALAVGW